MTFLSDYQEALTDVLLELAPWLLLGFVLAGVIETILPADRVLAWLGRGQRFAVLKAALFGVPLPLCSCGVVPVALSLRRRGAGRGPTVAFLVTTPQSGADSISATWGLMGPPFAIARAILTFVTGLVAGWTVDRIVPEAANRQFVPVEEDVRPTLLGRLFGPGWDLLQSIYGSLTWGILLAAAVSVLVPAGSLSGTMSGMIGMLVLAAVALPLYVCATASIPLALEFVDMGFSPGAAFVFLLLGPATNFATALIVRQEIGTRSMLAYLGAIVIFGLGAGTVVDTLGVTLTGSSTRMNHEPGLLSIVCATVLAAALVGLFIRSYRSPAQPLITTEHDLPVQGMTCEHCRQTVEKAVSGVEGVSDVNVNLQDHRVTFNGGDPEQVRAAVRDVGFQLS